jgi:hypothetical protein
MSAFITEIGDPQVPPPYEFPDVTVCSFRLETDYGSLQSLCDKFLNIGDASARGFEFRPIIPYIDLDILKYPKMIYDSPQYKNWGFARQTELYFRVFVCKYYYVGGIVVPSFEVSAFFPFLFVDNEWSLVAGREIVGFNKNIGKFRQQAASPWPYVVASTLVVKTFSPNTCLQFEDVITIRRPKRVGRKIVERHPANWFDAVFDRSLFPEDIIEALEDVQRTSPGLLSTVHLKQFRDVWPDTDACYQALVQAQYNVIPVGPVAPIAKPDIVIEEYDSFAVASELGLSPNQALRPVSQYTMNCNLSFGNAVTIFENNV